MKRWTIRFFSWAAVAVCMALFANWILGPRSDRAAMAFGVVALTVACLCKYEDS